MPVTLAPLLLLGFSVGILVASYAALPSAAYLFIGFVALLLFGVWFFAHRTAYFCVGLLLLLIAVGAFRTSLAPRALTPATQPLLGQKVELQGVVVGDPDIRESNVRIPIEVRAGSTTTRILAVTDRYPEFSYGDEVTVSGVLSTPEPFDTNGGRTFAYDAFLAKDGIFALAKHAHIERTGTRHDPLTFVLRTLYAGKHRFSRALEDALPEPHASLAEGLLAGGKQDLGQDLLDAFTIAGLLPIIVLSGYNVMIVAESVLAFLSFLPRRFALSLAGITILVFVFAAGGGASAFRALLMAALALFARATRRTYDALRALAAVYVLMLLISPLSLAFDPGFQFSFAATLGLILVSSAFEIRLIRIHPAALREVVATTLAAQLFVLPLLLYQTGNLSLVAIPANIFVLPLIPLTMALSACAGIVALVFPPVGFFVGLPAYLFLSYTTETAKLFASLPFAHVILPAFPAFLVPLLYIPVWLLVKWLRNMPTPVPSQIAPQSSPN
jgi:competence protein ComEC